MSTSPPASRPFDEQLWPIHVALVAWAGVLAGAVVALGGFDDPRLLHNGWARLATIAATLAVLAWAAGTVDSRDARRLKLAVVVSLMLHTLLVVALGREQLKLDVPRTEAVAAREQPADAAHPQEFSLRPPGDQSGREAFDRPVGTPGPAGSELAAEHRPSPDTSSLREPIIAPDVETEPAPQLLPLQQSQESLAEQLPSPADRPRQDAPPASAVAEVRPDLGGTPGATGDGRSDRELDSAVPSPEADERAAPPAAPQIALDVVTSIPEVAAQVVVQDLPHQRPVDPLPTIAHQRSLTPTPRRVQAAPLPETPPETERAIAQWASTLSAENDRRSDYVAEQPRPSPEAPGRATPPIVESLPSDVAPRATLYAPGSSLLAPRSATLPERRASDGEPGLRSGGTTDRSVRSRGPTPAAPVMTPLPLLAATGGTPGPAGGSRGDNEPGSSRPSPETQGRATPPRDAAGGALPRADAVVDVPGGHTGTAYASTGSGGTRSLSSAPRPLLPSRQVGGEPAPGGVVRRPAAAFAQRRARQQQPAAGQDGRPSTKTEAAIELGLEFLARAQQDDGRWELGYLGNGVEAADSPPIIRADAAATGLALLSFLGAGYDHFGDRYEHVVDRGLKYLIRTQAPSGEIFPEEGQAVSQVTRFYSHGIATLALCEAYGMTGDPQLRTPAQAALDYLAATQHTDRGGWRYDAGTSADLSVTGWQLLALRSGELAGLRVRPQVYQGIRYLVQQCREQGGQRALFRYHPWAPATDPRTRHGLEPGTVMTSVGLLVELYLGDSRDDRQIRLGADHLLANLPQLGNAGQVAPTGTLGNPQRDTYYWYYATQVMFHMGGRYWDNWQDALHPLLVQTQTPDGPLAGSWDPLRPQPDKWAAYGGRIYVTTLDLLSLEVTYRHLPLYNNAAPRVAEGP